MHDSAVASVQPRARQSARTCSATGRSSRAKRWRSIGSQERRLELVRASLGAGIREQVDVDLEVACADRRDDAVAVPARVRERARDRRLADAEEAQHTALGHPRARQHPPHRLGGQHVRPQALQLGRRPGQRGGDRVARLEDDRRSSSRQADRDAAVGHRRLLRDAFAEVAVRPFEPLCHRPGDAFDLRLEPAVDVDTDVGSLRQQLDRAIVVSRTEPAGEQQQVMRQTVADRPLELLGLVADDGDPGGLEPQAQHLAGEEGAVQVAPVAPDELGAARDDGDSRSRVRGRRQVAEAGCTPRRSISITRGLPPPPRDTRLPFTVTTRCSGVPALIQKRFAQSLSGALPFSSVPW